MFCNLSLYSFAISDDFLSAVYTQYEVNGDHEVNGDQQKENLDHFVQDMLNPSPLDDLNATGNAALNAKANDDLNDTGNDDLNATGHDDLNATGNDDLNATGNDDLNATGKGDHDNTDNEDEEDDENGCYNYLLKNNRYRTPEELERELKLIDAIVESAVDAGEIVKLRLRTRYASFLNMYSFLT